MKRNPALGNARMEINQWIESLDCSEPLGGRQTKRRITADDARARWGDKTTVGTCVTHHPDITDADGIWVPLYNGWIKWTGYGLLETEK